MCKRIIESQGVPFQNHPQVIGLQADPRIKGCPISEVRASNSKTGFGIIERNKFYVPILSARWKRRPRRLKLRCQMAGRLGQSGGADESGLPGNPDDLEE